MACKKTTGEARICVRVRRRGRGRVLGPLPALLLQGPHVRPDAGRARTLDDPRPLSTRAAAADGDPQEARGGAAAEVAADRRCLLRLVRAAGRPRRNADLSNSAAEERTRRAPQDTSPAMEPKNWANQPGTSIPRTLAHFSSPTTTLPPPAVAVLPELGGVTGGEVPHARSTEARAPPGKHEHAPSASLRPPSTRSEGWHTFGIARRVAQRLPKLRHDAA